MLADGMSLAVGLTGAENGGNSSVVSLAVGSWGITADAVPCADGSTASSGASADSS